MNRQITQTSNLEQLEVVVLVVCVLESEIGSSPEQAKAKDGSKRMNAACSHVERVQPAEEEDRSNPSQIERKASFKVTVLYCKQGGVVALQSFITETC